jgi:AcrR family transcriptional regulator
MGRRPQIDGRELLLEAALRLFADEGVDAVSIRAVNREAGLGPASVHYHFGTKDALLDAVLHRYGDIVTQRIRARAAELVDAEAPGDARQLVTMLAEPYLDALTAQGHEGLAWVRLMSQLLQQEPGRVLDPPSMRVISSAAARAYPHASKVDIRRAMHLCLMVLVTNLAHGSQQRRGSSQIGLLIEFLSAGLDAVLGQGNQKGYSRAIA